VKDSKISFADMISAMGKTTEKVPKEQNEPLEQDIFIEKAKDIFVNSNSKRANTSVYVLWPTKWTVGPPKNNKWGLSGDIDKSPHDNRC